MVEVAPGLRSHFGGVGSLVHLIIIESKGFLNSSFVIRHSSFQMVILYPRLPLLQRSSLL